MAASMLPSVIELTRLTPVRHDESCGDCHQGSRVIVKKGSVLEIDCPRGCGGR